MFNPLNPPKELVDSLSEKTLETFFDCMIKQTEPVVVMEMIGDIIKEEFDMHDFPYTEGQVRELSAALGLSFLDSLEFAYKEDKAANDDPITLH